MSRTLAAELANELAALLGPGGLLLDAAERLAYGYDNSRRQGLPLAVALPTSAQQVQAIVRLCREARMPIVARGRGTNTTGASVPGEDALVVSFERMDRVLDIRPGDRVAVVQPGLLNGDLQAALAPHGLFWPPDPTSAAFSTIGGNLACNAGGPRAVKYGASRDNVLGLVAVIMAGLDARRRELAVLRAVGAEPEEERNMVAKGKGLFVTVGVVRGTLASLLACWALSDWVLMQTGVVLRPWDWAHAQWMVLAGLLPSGRVSTCCCNSCLNSGSDCSESKS